MSQRNSNNSPSNENSYELQNHDNNRKDESSVEHNTNSTVNIYPNPITDNNAVVIEMLNSKEGLLTMYDVTGKTIITNKIYEGKNQLHLPNDCKGIYFIKIQNYENKIFNKKLVVY
jgi:hypothetical protein